MPKWVNDLLMWDVVIMCVLGARAVYLGRKFMNQVWLKEPEKSKELGFPPDGFCGSVDTMKGWWAKVKFDDAELERLRIRSKRAAICFLIAWIPPLLCGVIVAIKLIAPLVKRAL